MHYTKVRFNRSPSVYVASNEGGGCFVGMLSPLLGIAGVNSLLFAAYGSSKRLISPYPDLSLKQIAAAGAMAGAANAILASPGRCPLSNLKQN